MKSNTPHTEELDLTQTPLEGLKFSLNHQELNDFASFKEWAIADDKNTLEFELMPIDGPHYQVSFKIQVLRQQICSRCAEDFTQLFTKSFTEHLSTDVHTEGEDQGFILVQDQKKWNWINFIRESVELETPYQNYKYGEKCLSSCPHYDEALAKGWLTSSQQKKSSPFEALSKLKLKH